jgi:PKHD-type hydroxylase
VEAASARAEGIAGEAALPYLWTPPAVMGGWRVAGSSAPRRFHGALSNDFLQQPLLFRGALDAAQCERIARLGEAAPLWKGHSTAEEGYRRCQTSFLEEVEATRDVFDRLRSIAAAANDRYRFGLRGFGEPLHFVRYGRDDGFGWHTDLGDGAASTRKISISVLLSDAAEYGGGGFEFCPHGLAAQFAGRGTALVFPSFVPHRVLPVERGVRRALVAWIHGDAFT